MYVSIKLIDIIFILKKNKETCWRELLDQADIALLYIEMGDMGICRTLNFPL